MRKRMKMLALLLILSLGFTACAGDPARNSTENTEAEKESKRSEYNDGVIGGRKNSGKDLLDIFRSEKSVAPDGYFYEAPEAVMEADIDAGADYPGGNGQISAGTLTAGEWKDLKDMSAWLSKLQESEWRSYAAERGLFAENYVKVSVKDGDAAVVNAKAELLAGQEVVYAARTDIEGNAWLFYDLTGEVRIRPDAVRVSGKTEVLDGRTELSFDLEGSTAVTQLDLMLMIDTTGSMGDELRYITAELVDMVERIAQKDEAISIRVSVNFYRDEGDDYVVKYYDFRTDIQDCLEQLQQEKAEGGGDAPEAVHTALDNAVCGHSWREDAVKLCYLILDAPPHSEAEVQGVGQSLKKSLAGAAEQGIRLIPVASSGVDAETELLLRSFAVLTGGTYIFLTNDSGIGYYHKEAEVGDYSVEALNECMIRVACEYCGLPYEKVYEPKTQESPLFPTDFVPEKVRLTTLPQSGATLLLWDKAEQCYNTLRQLNLEALSDEEQEVVGQLGGMTSVYSFIGTANELTAYVFSRYIRTEYNGAASPWYKIADRFEPYAPPIFYETSEVFPPTETADEPVTEPADETNPVCETEVTGTEPAAETAEAETLPAEETTEAGTESAAETKEAETEPTEESSETETKAG